MRKNNKYVLHLRKIEKPTYTCGDNIKIDLTFGSIMREYQFLIKQITFKPDSAPWI
jgi:hypothetical protein